MNQDRWNMDYTETSDGKICKGAVLEFPDGSRKKIKTIVYINMLVDRFDFEDGSSCFCGDEYKIIEYGDWRDLPEKNEQQCEFCGRFFLDLEKHKRKIHGGKEQTKLEVGK